MMIDLPELKEQIVTCHKPVVIPLIFLADTFFSCPIILFHYPSMVGALLFITVSSCLAILHPSQLLRCRLSLVADRLQGCAIEWQ